MSPGKTVCMLASLLALGCAATPGQCDAPMDCEDGLLAIDDAYVRISVTTTSAGNPNTNSGGEKRVRPWIEAIYGTSNLALLCGPYGRRSAAAMQHARGARDRDRRAGRAVYLLCVRLPGVPRVGGAAITPRIRG